MTVSKKLQTTLITLEGILADFKVSYMEASDIQTKTTFKSLVTQTENVLHTFKDRIDEMQKEEPQYREENE
ncbi:hypothetical protein QBE52_05735 [Clostridiaceae bacterium 35-E11]